MFRIATNHSIDSRELGKLYRAYQIKKTELEEDKKALSKYKYDP